ncbi:MAG: cysteine--tRNA ligase [Prevotellaceae bacterium]|jgi:cysteinyl-tRNA synthetase|nr:cysteine--tRNA ligase [Prevotellaceae bacterium]
MATTASLQLYNTLSRRKEPFAPLNPPHVGLYVCGPTVYGDPHLGHARPAITFDLLFRYLQHLGCKVRYVRNITDVGHLENDADAGEDKIAKKARLERLEPTEVAQRYTNRYHDAMRALNVLPPSIEPHASGHIIEQIALVQAILRNGFAYEANGSVYFDVEAYSRQHTYGKLSGRTLDELQGGTRSLDGQGDKRQPYDFALWKKAAPEHIMRWPSPWGEGFPGWHLECSAMSTKYLGEEFDIHGGGLDLMFPHHECEIAQSVAACGHEAARTWVHNNMITINGQKMGKSLGNFITLEALFAGSHPLLAQAYSPMTIRFFILQAHYRSTLDFGNEALQAAEKGLQRLLAAQQTLQQLKPTAASTLDVPQLMAGCCAALDDDLNTAVALAVVAEWVKNINSLKAGTASLTAADLQQLRTDFATVVEGILGLKEATPAGSGQQDLSASLIGLLLDLRQQAKAGKDFATSDKIRNELAALGVAVKDTKEGAQWSLES